MDSFLFYGLGLSLGAKLVSTNDWPSFFSNNIRPFFLPGAKNKLRSILHRPVGRTPKHVCRNFRAKNRRSDLPVFNIKQNLAKKLDPTPKSRNLKEITYLTQYCDQTSKCPRRFRDRP